MHPLWHDPQTVLVWSLFPIVWTLGVLNVVTPYTEELLYIVINLVAKFVYPLAIGSELESTSSSLRQITKRMKVQTARIRAKRIMQANRILEIAMQNAENTAQQQRNFLANMSHELRNPLKFCALSQLHPLAFSWPPFFFFFQYIHVHSR